MGCQCSGASTIEQFLTEFVEELKVRKFSDKRYIEAVEKFNPFSETDRVLSELLSANQINNIEEHKKYTADLLSQPRQFLCISTLFLTVTNPKSLSSHYLTLVDRLKNKYLEATSKKLDSLYESDLNILKRSLLHYCRMISYDVVEACTKCNKFNLAKEQSDLLKDMYSSPVIEFYVIEILKNYKPGFSHEEFFTKNLSYIQHSQVRDHLRMIWSSKFANAHKPNTLHIPRISNAGGKIFTLNNNVEHANDKNTQIEISVPNPTPTPTPNPTPNEPLDIANGYKPYTFNLPRISNNEGNIFNINHNVEHANGKDTQIEISVPNPTPNPEYVTLPDNSLVSSAYESLRNGEYQKPNLGLNFSAPAPLLFNTKNKEKNNYNSVGSNTLNIGTPFLFSSPSTDFKPSVNLVSNEYRPSFDTDFENFRKSIKADINNFNPSVNLASSSSNELNPLANNNLNLLRKSLDNTSTSLNPTVNLDFNNYNTVNPVSSEFKPTVNTDFNYNSNQIRNSLNSLDTDNLLKSYTNVDYKFNNSYNLFKQECLTYHNEKRRLHQVPLLVEDESLNLKAQEWANKLAESDFLNHSNCDWNGKIVGENIAKAGAVLDNPGSPICKKWYSEVDNYNFANHTQNGTCKNFIQMVWKETKQVGFGFAYSKSGNTFVVVNYYPAGNNQFYLGENVLPIA